MARSIDITKNQDNFGMPDFGGGASIERSQNETLSTSTVDEYATTYLTHTGDKKETNIETLFSNVLEISLLFVPNLNADFFYNHYHMLEKEKDIEQFDNNNPLLVSYDFQGKEKMPRGVKIKWAKNPIVQKSQKHDLLSNESRNTSEEIIKNNSAFIEQAIKEKEKFSIPITKNTKDLDSIKFNTRESPFFAKGGVLDLNKFDNTELDNKQNLDKKLFIKDYINNNSELPIKNINEDVKKYSNVLDRLISDVKLDYININQSSALGEKVSDLISNGENNEKIVKEISSAVNSEKYQLELGKTETKNDIEANKEINKFVAEIKETPQSNSEKLSAYGKVIDNQGKAGSDAAKQKRDEYKSTINAFKQGVSDTELANLVGKYTEKSKVKVKK